ncbi:helix-turn-helix domain-containing protein [Streptomyces sp. NPDC002913]
MAQEAAADDWSAGLALSIAAEVRRHRQAQGLSAQQLSERCAKLGMPIQRSVLANLESGRRSTVNVAELLVLAAALQVAPAQLLFPVGHREKIEVLPGVEESPYEAVQWLRGSKWLGRYGKFIAAMSSPITAYDWHAKSVDHMYAAMARRDRYRRQYLEALERKERGRDRYSEVEAEIAELSSKVTERTERLRGVPLAERPPKEPDFIAMQDRLSELRDEAGAHRQAREAVHYLKESAPAAEGQVLALARRIARTRWRMERSGWVPPELPNKIADYVESAYDPDAFAEEEFEHRADIVEMLELDE